MIVVALVVVWLTFVLPLAFGALGRHRSTTKIGALLVLAAVLATSCLFVELMMAGLSENSNTSSWPSPWWLAGALTVAYILVAIAAFRRKLT